MNNLISAKEKLALVIKMKEDNYLFPVWVVEGLLSTSSLDEVLGLVPENERQMIKNEILLSVNALEKSSPNYRSNLIDVYHKLLVWMTPTD